MNTYKSFKEWVIAEILPLAVKYPARVYVGNWTKEKIKVERPPAVAQFWHQYKLWKVDGDTHMAPVLLAYQAMLDNTIDPFVVVPPKNDGGKTCLELAPDVDHGKHKYFFVYQTDETFPRNM